MFWTALGFMGVAGAVAVFIVSTDGRYFGKRVAFLMYNQLGPLLFFSSRDERKWAKLIECVDVSGEKAVLDVGTAMGRLPMAIAQASEFRGKVTGVDWSPRMIRSATQRSNRLGLDGSAAFEVLDVRDGLPFEEASFDVVFCLGLLETLQSPEEVLGELARVARPGGTLVLSAYSGRSSWGYSLPYRWYLHNLSALGLDQVERIPFRTRYDFIIAHVSDGFMRSS
jgi:ubiquinone/menaquinone biosynthesis C-methylase UbiE